jgi:ssDNA-specific exonuclease RecJ
VLRISMATVIGTTPLGTVVMAWQMSLTFSKSTSPQIVYFLFFHKERIFVSGTVRWNAFIERTIILFERSIFLLQKNGNFFAKHYRIATTIIAVSFERGALSFMKGKNLPLSIVILPEKSTLPIPKNRNFSAKHHYIECFFQVRQL